ncbi:MAG TPA: hypothetical protein VEL05_04180 [Candidatus Acidoferrum sp.]|nr:hypothetical protein [Candidatus Acidoferrum sp.]
MFTRAAIAALLAASAGCAFGATRAAYEARTAARLEPAAVEPTPTEGGSVGVLRVRVFVDEDYRAQNRRHSQEIGRLFARASALLEPTVGLRLEVVEVADWKRRSGDDLQAVLDELVSLDPAEDVDLVVGMISGLARVEVQLHHLGMARVFGHHLVLRGLNDAVEVKELDRALGTVDEKVRRGLYARRRQHKELVILLHEIAHTLGGLHVTAPGDLLHWQYDHQQSSFGADNAQLMRAVAAAKLAKGPEAGAGWRLVLARVRVNPSQGWNEDEKAELVTELEELSRGESSAGERKGEAIGDAVRASDRERFRAAERLEGAGRPLDAWEELEPLIDYYPDEPGVQRFACRLAVAAERDRASVETRCSHAAQLGPGEADPQLRLAQWYLAGGDKAKSLAAAHKALELLQRSAAGATGGSGEDPGAERTWLDLARHFQALRAVTWAEKAAAGTSKAKDVAEWARATRVRFGMPAGGAIPPEREGEYVAGVSELLQAVYSRQYADAEKRAASLERTFRGAPGIHAARCDMEVRLHHYPAARAQCRAALRLYADSAWAHYLIGLLDKHDKNPAAALEHLERAIALDPDLKHAYEVAGDLYKQLGRAEDRKRLGEKYRAHFSHELP